ncbi:MAG: hypothetical protein KJ049_07695 [Gammaproteobacteria bacterium]|jgi:hypothetical protein|nr:hypothetical protein [Gammaproteobacteria bacterium]
MSNPGRRILYVPGVRAKPSPDLHREVLRKCVIEGIRRADAPTAEAISARPECLRLVPWGHLFYPDYRDLGLDAAGIDGLLADPAPGRTTIREIFSARRQAASFLYHLCDRVPLLIEWLADPDTRINISDSMRYFDNHGGVAGRIRALLAAELQSAWAAGDRVLLMGHSLGSVIAWDTLWELGHSVRPGPADAGVDLFLTLGSPLGTRFVRRRLLGAGTSGAGRYPRGIHRWRNLAALGDRTALGHRFADDYAEMLRLGLVADITDRTDLVNPFRNQEGLNPHKCYGYFVNATTGAAIAEWWRAEAPP